MNQYLISKKISFIDLTLVHYEEGAIICLACGCEMPRIYLKAKTTFEKDLNKIGFTKSYNPKEEKEQQAKDDTIAIDLNYQGLFLKEDRDTSKINYAIINKQQNVTCGDNICHPRENYLYEIDLSKNCSILSERIINFDHCPQDCKNTFNQSMAITKEEFNKLKITCQNQPQPEKKEPEKSDPTGMPMPDKPIAQMNQFERNEYVKKLQQHLIVLLNYLIALMMAQR